MIKMNLNFCATFAIYRAIYSLILRSCNLNFFNYNLVTEEPKQIETSKSDEISTENPMENVSKQPLIPREPNEQPTTEVPNHVTEDIVPDSSSESIPEGKDNINYLLRPMSHQTFLPIIFR